MSRRRKTLSAEDRALWDRVAATATPMQKPARAPAVEAPTPARPSPSPTAPKPPSFRIGERARPAPPAVMQSPALAERIDAAPVRMHHGTHKKMVRGKITPEDRIDLHGMTLAAAHPRLIGFVTDAYARGLRLVLVITGKGRDRDGGGPIPAPRGILRHQVPAWLAAPPLGQIVLDIRTAHRSHGGEGAYYVYLKRRR
ncbi:MAG: Smr/MutS family protein [Pseudomonadota bacterium]